MRRLFFQVFMRTSTQPESQARMRKLSAMLEASVLTPRLRVRIETRIRIGMSATVMSVQSRAMKPPSEGISSCHLPFREGTAYARACQCPSIPSFVLRKAD